MKNYTICKFTSGCGDERLDFRLPTDDTVSSSTRKRRREFYKDRERGWNSLGYSKVAEAEVDKCEFHNRRAEYSVWELFRALDKAQDVKSMRKYMGMPFGDYERLMRRIKDQVRDIQYRYNRSVNVLNANDLKFSSEIAVGCYSMMQKDPGALIDSVPTMCQI